MNFGVHGSEQHCLIRGGERIRSDCVFTEKSRETKTCG
jgi:hypothetical protein